MLMAYPRRSRSPELINGILESVLEALDEITHYKEAGTVEAIVAVDAYQLIHFTLETYSRPWGMFQDGRRRYGRGWI